MHLVQLNALMARRKQDLSILDQRAAIMPFLFANRGVTHGVPFDKFLVTGSVEQKPKGMPGFKGLAARFQAIANGGQVTN